jgi:hypothetical protein
MPLVRRLSKGTVVEPQTIIGSSRGPLAVCAYSIGQRSQTGMRTQVIVVVAPRGDDLTSFPECQEDVLIIKSCLI